MKHKSIYIFPLLLILMTNCQNNNHPEELVEDAENESSLDSNELSKRYSVDTNDLECKITSYEYLKRENRVDLYSDEVLQKLKDSIKYDSIILNRVLPVFD